MSDAAAAAGGAGVMLALHVGRQELPLWCILCGLSYWGPGEAAAGGCCCGGGRVTGSLTVPGVGVG